MSDYRAMSTKTSAQREAPPDPSDVLISTATKDLLADRDLTVADLSYNAGIPISTLYRKLNGAQAWKASDISRVARYFGVPVGDLFSGKPPLDRRRKHSRAAISGHASTGNTHRYVAPERDYRFSRNVTSDEPLARVA